MWVSIYDATNISGGKSDLVWAKSKVSGMSGMK